jgi:hypothetical protein
VQRRQYLVEGGDLVCARCSLIGSVTVSGPMPDRLAGELMLVVRFFQGPRCHSMVQRDAACANCCKRHCKLHAGEPHSNSITLNH